MSGFSPALPAPVRAELPGFPTLLRSVGEARQVIEAQRLPVRRSQACWCDAYNRLTLAGATGKRSDVEAAYRALTIAIAKEHAAKPEMAYRQAA